MIWILLVVFQLKHFIADYPLQTPYMLGKFKDKGWVAPLALHCYVHFAFTYIISGIAFLISGTPGFTKYAFAIALVDFTIHFAMDRIKASPRMLGQYESLSKEQFKGLSEARSLAVSAYSVFSGTPAEDTAIEAAKEIVRIDAKFRGNKYFWWALGFDQMVHHLTDILVIYLILKVI